MASQTLPVRGAPGMDPGRREDVILRHMPLVRALARRYANRGEPLDDLEQVATIGLIKAVDRFDAAKGSDFRSFATPTILGEIRRHFRDRTWTMRVPRGLKDDHAKVVAAVGALSGRLGHSPTVAEISAESGLTQEQVLDAIAAQGAYRPGSLSQMGPDRDDEGESQLEIPTQEAGYGTAEGRADLRRGLAGLPARERVIVHLRFDRGMTQSEIAAIVGVSQMHVSRLLARALESMRQAAERA